MKSALIMMLGWLRKQGWKPIVVLLGLWFAFDLGTYLVAESLWFGQIGYLPAFLLRLSTQGALWAIALVTTNAYLFGNLILASRLKYPKFLVSVEDYDLKPSGIGLRWLSLIGLGLSLAIALILYHYGRIALENWHPQQTLESVSTSLPSRLRPDLIAQYLTELPHNLVLILLLVGVAIALMSAAQFSLSAIALAMSLGLGLIFSEHWHKVLQYFQPTRFDLTDPLFNQDISFYVFSLPLLELLDFGLLGITSLGLVSAIAIYILSGDSLRNGRFPGFSSVQLRHLYGLSAAVMGSLCLSFWLSRYELLYSTRGVAYGASYTDVTAQLPINTALSILAGAIALFLLYLTLTWPRDRHPYKQSKHWLVTFLQPSTRNLIQIFALFLTTVTVSNYAIPLPIQRFIVQPNELARERPYIERSILYTRAAFDLNNIEVRTFDPEDSLTVADIRDNNLTIDNIRLWDTRPLLQTNRQLQQIRLYYKFPDADIDRYTFLAEGSEATEKQQVILAARELDFNAVPQQAQTWINKHLVYTHGYGFTMSPVNTVDPAGLPEYYVKDIGIEPVGTAESTLGISSERVRASIPIGEPRIYYGEQSNTNVIAPSGVPELDYPSGDENVYNTYDGRGGVPLQGSLWRRFLFAKYLKNWQVLFTRNLTDETRVLFRRNIHQRIRAIAPFLRFDRDPYLVVADADLYAIDPVPGATDSPPAENYLYWIIDAYTTSDRYPYSDPGDRSFNYIRNSVKVVVDAYNGSVRFFVADLDDPIIQTFASLFPEMFQPLEAMTDTLRSHIRYPIDFFNIQSERLLAYHMTDPQVFYNREDQWRVPLEIYGSETQKVEPYYLIMRLPTETPEEFILLLPFTPESRNNLIAWLAGRSDGENYGRLLLYQFPKQQLIYGPEQIEARINQDPQISQQISLWNRQGSRAIQGNLLVIPIENSLLYVEPLYLEAEQNSLPTLVRVIVAYGNQIVMAETLDLALDAIFLQPEAPPAPTIIRPLEEVAPPLE